MEEKQARAKLIKIVEARIGRKIQTPKDFEFLSEQIFDSLHQHISPTTLKRLWGYLPEPSEPRLSTLNLLSKFADYDSWETFCKQSQEDVFTVQAPVQPPKKEGKGKRMIIVWAILLLAVLACSYFFIEHTGKQMNPPSDERYILKLGQRFDKPQDYLKYFGITATDTLWGRPVPHHDRMFVWTPEYHNRHWHNEGDSAQMMPTITEHWEPDEYQASPEVIAQRNKDQYWHYFRHNEIRITFMKNLVDSAYVFLGVYRMAIEKSDTTRCVWERVIDECDLNNLDYLEQFRN